MYRNCDKTKHEVARVFVLGICSIVQEDDIGQQPVSLTIHAQIYIKSYTKFETNLSSGSRGFRDEYLNGRNYERTEIYHPFVEWGYHNYRPSTFLSESLIFPKELIVLLKIIKQFVEPLHTDSIVTTILSSIQLWNASQREITHVK